MFGNGADVKRIIDVLSCIYICLCFQITSSGQTTNEHCRHMTGTEKCTSNFFIFVFGKKDVYVCVISRFYPVRISLEKKVLTLNVNIPNISVTMYFHKCFLHQIMEYVVNHFYFAGFAINLIYLS